jgi:hypothetical protein
LVKARRQLAHGQFSSVNYSGPRIAYAIDFYGVAESAGGFKWILTVIDLFSREVVFIPTRSREAPEVVEVLLRCLVNVKGVPLFLVSDDAKEFLSKLVQGFADALGIRRITTKPYNPRGNAICESVHRFLGQCLTRLSLEERVTWDTRVNEFSFAHDTAFHDSLGCTPFEVGHGSLARTLTSSMILSDSDSKFSTTSDVKGFYGRLKIAAKEYHNLARTTAESVQAEQNARLDGSLFVRLFTIL